METHDLARAYWTTSNIVQPWSSPVRRGWTAETEEPFRQGRCIVLHIPGTRYGLAFGWWGRDGDEEATLNRLGVRPLAAQDFEMDEADC